MVAQATAAETSTGERGQFIAELSGKMECVLEQMQSLESSINLMETSEATTVSLDPESQLGAELGSLHDDYTKMEKAFQVITMADSPLSPFQTHAFDFGKSQIVAVDAAAADTADADRPNVGAALGISNVAVDVVQDNDVDATAVPDDAVDVGAIPDDAADASAAAPNGTGAVDVDGVSDGAVGAGAVSDDVVDSDDDSGDDVDAVSDCVVEGPQIIPAPRAVEILLDALEGEIEEVEGFLKGSPPEATTTAKPGRLESLMPRLEATTQASGAKARSKANVPKPKENIQADLRPKKGHNSRKSGAMKDLTPRDKQRNISIVARLDGGKSRKASDTKSGLRPPSVDSAKARKK